MLARAQDGRVPVETAIRTSSLPVKEDPRQHLAEVAPVNVAAEESRRVVNERIERIKIIGEINHLTVELFKRETDAAISKADTPALVKRLKELAAKLHDQ